MQRWICLAWKLRVSPWHPSSLKVLAPDWLSTRCPTAVSGGSPLKQPAVRDTSKDWSSSLLTYPSLHFSANEAKIPQAAGIMYRLSAGCTEFWISDIERPNWCHLFLIMGVVYETVWILVNCNAWGFPPTFSFPGSPRLLFCLRRTDLRSFRKHPLLCSCPCLSCVEGWDLSSVSPHGNRASYY
jgi:hypothetical protein